MATAAVMRTAFSASAGIQKGHVRTTKRVQCARNLLVKASSSPRTTDAGKGMDIAGISLATLGASTLVAGHADAAQQMADLASDNRLGSILFLLAPALGWVGFNILGPFQNQLKDMPPDVAFHLRQGMDIAGISLATLGASTLVAGHADAAQQMADLASDNRLGSILFLL
eukprot:CAMPEP_0113919462 /NCGR_PEP_ID=MMETSP1159-20121227/33_1 /TAXON_ID=88271 /ORGANISM="Picocystis salinarum" /LENGTH=169 /DNA_ID=CAMNT_0000919387 /DNA_START=151 /DNA_END=656 /DNA_ORIENTATION=+ /assembly_acc=CAM_ASM_000767